MPLTTYGQYGLSPGQAMRHSFGGLNGYFQPNHTPQLDARPIVPFIDAGGGAQGAQFSGPGPLWYGDFQCERHVGPDPGLVYWTYAMTVRNDGLEPCLYEVRVWMPQ
jgi:hypothetical protein